MRGWGIGNQLEGNMRNTRQIRIAILVALLICAPIVCRAQMVLGLEKDFIETYKDKATIATRFHVDAIPAHADPHTIGEGSKDGDIHMAGRDSVIRLPLVAEIINARKEPKPMTFLKNLLNDGALGKEIDLTGVWRIWFEHLSTTPQIQKEDFPIPNNSGMAHAFELHPVTMFDTFDCTDSFVPIKSSTQEFKAYDADRAFKQEYDKLELDIELKGTKVMLTAGLGQINYAEFIMELAAKPKSVGDGFIVPAKVYEVGEEDHPLIQRNRRMVFVKDTAPSNAVKNMAKGESLHVVGIPRVNLHAVSLIVNNLAPNEKWHGTLPYEMIIVAILN
jgi:hypothetical protein